LCFTAEFWLPAFTSNIASFEIDVTIDQGPNLLRDTRSAGEDQPQDQFLVFEHRLMPIPRSVVDAR
jgi:hypothetical protein